MKAILIVFLVGQLFTTQAFSTEKLIFPEDNEINFKCPRVGIAPSKFSVNITGPYEMVLVDICVKANCSDLRNFKTRFNHETGDYNITYIPENMKYLRQLVRILCIYDEEISRDFEVVVFSRPENTCEAPTLTETTVKIKCTSHKVFPSVEWSFIFKNNKSEAYGEVYYIEEEVEIDELTYLVFNITFESPLVNFDEGVYEFSAVVSPAGHNNTQYNQDTIVPSIVTLFLPRVALEKGCHSHRNLDGLTAYGANVDCMCYLETIGKPPGKLAWVNLKGKEVGIRLNSYAAVLNLTQANNREVYFCEVSSVLRNFSATIPFSVLYEAQVKIEIKLNGYIPLIFFILFLLLVIVCIICTIKQCSSYVL